MSQQPESGPPVLKLYAIELPDGSIAMNGPYVLATENEGQAGRMAHARDGQEIAFVRELQQAQGVGEARQDLRSCTICGLTVDLTKGHVAPSGDFSTAGQPHATRSRKSTAKGDAP